MPGTEKGVKEIKRICSPCYGSPFMPRKIKDYSDLLIKRINEHNCNVFLVNTGMDNNGERFALDYTRNSIKRAIDSNIPADDTSKQVADILSKVL